MKFPSGYGSVYKMHGNRRRPWTVRITIARVVDSEGYEHWKYKYLGYYEDQQSALIALAKYNADPYDLDANRVTFSDIFEKWSTEHYPHISKSNIHGYNAAYKICRPLYKMKFSSIKKSHLQNVIDTCGKNYPMLRKVRILFTALFKYAMQNDVVSKDYARYVNISQYSDRNPDKRERIPFTPEEIKILWEQKDEYISIILMLIYSGVRVSELLDLKKENVNLSGQWFDIIASKTKSGIRRVPIADKVLPFFKHWYNKDCDYLLSRPDGKKFEYEHYRLFYWMPEMESLKITHTPHDTRHTCISMLTAARVDERIIQKIVGHKGHSITENVYTHFDIQTLLDAVNEI